MLQPIIQSASLTHLGRPLSEYRDVLTESKASVVETVLDRNVEYGYKRQSEYTELDYIGKSEVKAYEATAHNFPIEGHYSTNYVDFNRRLMLKGLSFELAEWIAKGTDQAIPHVANIKRFLDRYSGYLEQSSDTRLLLGSLELIFENNEWESMPEKKLSFLKAKIDYMADNELDFRQVKNFLKELHMSKIRVLKPGYDEKEEVAKKSA